MRKNAILILAMFFTLQASSQSNPSAHFNKIYSFALQENIAKALHHLDTLANDQLTEAQRATKEKYYRRFACRMNHRSILPIARSFPCYNTTRIIEKRHCWIPQKPLKENIRQFLTTQHYTNDRSVKGDIVTSFTQHLKHFLQQRGYYAATAKPAACSTC